MAFVLVISSSNIQPAHATSLVDGTYSCTTGQHSTNTPNFTINSGVVSNGENCVGSVIIPDGAIAIDNGAFYYANGISSVSLPYGIISIGEYAFSQAQSLTSINLPVSLNSIGVSAFEGATALTLLNIPANVHEIGLAAFKYTPSLTGLNVDASNIDFSSDAGVLYELSVGQKTTLLAYPSNKPEQSYLVPASVTSIGEYAFYGTNILNSLNFANGSALSAIGKYAFAGTNSLTEINLPDSLTVIDDYAFSSTGLISITIPANVLSLGDYAFSSATYMEEINFPSSSRLASIGDYAFLQTRSLRTFTVPATVITIGHSTFSSAVSLTEVIFGDGIQITQIPKLMFSHCTSLTTVTIPESVTEIGEGAFGSASALNSVTIPSRVTTMGRGVFMFADSLTAINVHPSNTSFAAEEGVLFLLNSGLKTKLVAYPANKSGASYTVPSTVTMIGDRSFVATNWLQTVQLPESLTSIDDAAFYQSTSLTSIAIPQNVATLGQSIFSGATQLRQVNFHGNSQLISIPHSAFYNAHSLISINIPNRVSTISNYSFYGTTSLLSITIPESVTSLGEGSFWGANKLTSVNFSENSQLTSIGRYAFNGTSSLLSIYIPSSVTLIDEGAFLYAGRLARFNFGGNAPTIGRMAFSYINTSAKAAVNSEATGFGAIGSDWNGLKVIDANLFSVNYNSNGGSFVQSGSFFKNGAIEAPPSEPVRSGYLFQGWATMFNGSRIQFPYFPQTQNDVTLYALWVPITYNIPINNGNAARLNEQLDIAKRTLRVKSSLNIKVLAKQVDVNVISPKATISISIAKSSNKICSKSGAKLKTIRSGNCIVTFTVQEPKPKRGKKPKAVKTIKTFIIQP